MSALTSHYQRAGIRIQVPEPGSQALMWELGGVGGWHSHAQILQGISSENEGFVHVMGELEHTAREQSGLTQPGCAHPEPTRLPWESQLPAAPTPHVSFSLPFSPHPPSVCHTPGLNYFFF